MNTTACITLERVTFSYPNGKKALNNLNFTIPRGVKAAFIGPNGAGKSTLFQHLNALLRPVSGRLLLNGQPYQYSRAGITKLRQSVGLVFQDPDHQLFADTVFNDVLFGPLNLGLATQKAKQQAEAALDAVKMEKFSNMPIHMLSYGQKKRVAIAGVLAMKPSVLLLDEPGAGLDCSGLQDLSEIMDALSAAGTTLIVSTHDMDWVWQWADCVYVLVAGQLAAAGPIEEILTKPYTDKHWFANPIIGQLYTAVIRPACRRTILPRTVEQVIALLQK